MQPVVIIGGGIIGLCTAFALHQRGCSVMVIDAGPRERAASHVNAGWIVPTLAEPVPSPGLIATSLRWMLRSDSPLDLRPRLDPSFLRWTLHFWRHCNARDYLAGTEATAAFGACSLALYDAMREAGVQYEEHRDGLLFVYRAPAALEHDYAALEPIRRFGFDVSAPMDGAEIRTLEPSLAATVTGGYWLPQERSVRPDSLVRGLVDYLQERGIEVRQDTQVTGIETTGRLARAVFAGGQRIPAQAIVVAAGAWTPRLLKPLRVNVPIEAGKGYSIDLTPAPALPHPVSRPLYLHETRVAITPLDGMIRLAGTMELSGLNHDMRQERVTAIARSAGWAIHGWPHKMPTSGPGVQIWNGPRPMTPDGLPVIGWLPGYRNLIVASGHAMLGVTLAPATGDAVADLITAGRAPDVIAPFDPARFTKGERGDH
ncbi:MAG: FAD-dependent oxidoreductase [Chloroflexi bacterium]|nr:FAD-dependent oxidoreductase [Chloroflexota bacterium]